jgi:hypothetical protein
MLDYILFWLALVAVLVGVVVFIFICLLAYGAYLEFKEWNRERKCKHPTYRENRACHGICPGCGKDLGFIQPLRADKSKKEL